MLVAGEAGIGKSRLAEAVLADHGEAAYVSVNSTSPDTGAVLRLPLRGGH